MTILSQAEAIRDATLPGANTPAIVGGCLVDIANSLGASTISSAFFLMNGGSGTVIADDAAYPVEGTGVVSTITGTGITIETNVAPDFKYIDGLNTARAYKVDVSLGFESDTADIYALFTLRDITGAEQYQNPVSLYLHTADKILPFAFSTVVTGTESTLVLYCELSDPSGATIQIGSISITMVDLGVPA